MDENAARTLLAQLHRAVPARFVIWRELDPDEDDVDVAVAAGGEADLRRALEDAGLEPEHRHEGRFFWDRPGLRVDVREAAAWPDYYPSLSGVVTRTVSEGGVAPMASAEDRLLIMASDAVYGRPLDRVVERSRELLAQPGVRERTAGLARDQGFEGLLPLLNDPDRLAGEARNGRLPYPRAMQLALRSGPARRALSSRLSKLGQLGATRALGRRLER